MNSKHLWPPGDAGSLCFLSGFPVRTRTYQQDRESRDTTTLLASKGREPGIPTPPFCPKLRKKSEELDTYYCEIFTVYLAGVGAEEWALWIECESHVDGDTALVACIPSLPLSPWFERTKSREKKMRAERTIVRVDKLTPSRSTHLQGPRVVLPNKEHVFLSIFLPQKLQQPVLNQVQVTELGVQIGGVNSKTNKDH